MKEKEQLRVSCKCLHRTTAWCLKCEVNQSIHVHTYTYQEEGGEKEGEGTEEKERKRAARSKLRYTGLGL